MKVAVAGGTGFIGRAATRACLGAGHEVVVLSRHRPTETIDWRPVDITVPGSIAPALAGCAAVIDAVQFSGMPIEDRRRGLTFERIDLEGTKNLVAAARDAGIGHFVGLSGVGASDRGPYHWLRYKAEEERSIRESGLAYTIFRPSWVYGPDDVSLNRLLRTSRWLPFAPVIGDGRAPIAPLFVDDLGAHLAAALDEPRARNQVFEIGGPETLTMDEVMRVALAAAGRRRIVLHFPKRLMRWVGTIANRLPGRPLTADAVEFITMPAPVENSAVVAAFGLPLTPLRIALSSYL